MNIGERIMWLRNEHELTQSDLGKEVGLSKQSISNIERGVSTPDIFLLCQMAHFFNISLDELVGFESKESEDNLQEIYFLNTLRQMDEKQQDLTLTIMRAILHS